MELLSERPARLFVRGQAVDDEGKIVAGPGHGRFEARRRLSDLP